MQRRTDQPVAYRPTYVERANAIAPYNGLQVISTLVARIIEGMLNMDAIVGQTMTSILQDSPNSQPQQQQQQQP